MNGWVSEQADVVTPPYRGRIVRLKLHLPAEDPSVRRCGRGLASLGPHVPWAQAVQRAAFALHLCSRENTLFPGKGNNARLCPEKREKCQAGDLLPQSLQMVYSQKPKSTLHLAIETLRRVRVTGAEATAYTSACCRDPTRSATEPGATARRPPPGFLLSAGATCLRTRCSPGGPWCQAHCEAG